MKRLIQYTVKRAFYPVWFVDGVNRQQYYSIVAEFRLIYILANKYLLMSFLLNITVLFLGEQRLKHPSFS